MLHCGERYIQGALRRRGICIQRWWERDALITLDPIGLLPRCTTKTWALHPEMVGANCLDHPWSKRPFATCHVTDFPLPTPYWRASHSAFPWQPTRRKWSELLHRWDKSFLNIFFVMMPQKTLRQCGLGIFTNRWSSFRLNWLFKVGFQAREVLACAHLRQQ